MRKLLAFLYGLLSYVFFFGWFLYLLGFLSNFGVPKTVDRGAETALFPALAIDVGLLLLFGLQHSIMPRLGFKAWLTRFIPRELERSTYVLVSTLVGTLLIWQWRPITISVWMVESLIGRAAIYGLFVLGVLTILATSFMINHFDLFGLRQVYLYLRSRKYSAPSFQMKGLYSLVHNPMHTATITIFWATPEMTLGHLVLAVGMSVYTLIGIYYEERDLERYLGKRFQEYQAKTPSLLPRLLPQGWSAKLNRTIPGQPLRSRGR